MKLYSTLKVAASIAVGFGIGYLAANRGRGESDAVFDEPRLGSHRPTQSDYLDEKAQNHAAYRLLLIELAIDRYAESLGSDPSRNEPSPESILLVEHLRSLIDLPSFPLVWRARRLLGEMLVQENRFKEAEAVLSVYSEEPTPVYSEEIRDYVSCLLTLGAVYEVLGEGELALGAYRRSLKYDFAGYYSKYTNSRIQLVSSVVPYPARSADDGELYWVLNPLRTRPRFGEVEVTKIIRLK